MKFKDKVVIITWASRWIWRATALFFWKEWAKVVVNYLHSKDNAEKVVENIITLWWQAIIYKCDISQENEVISMMKETVKKWGRLDILINNAGISNSTPIFERTVEQWKRTMDVNLLGTFLCCKYGVREMLKTGGWKIINIWSINGTKDFCPDLIDYDVSKAGIIALTKNFSKAFSPKVIVNTIAPWSVSTQKSLEMSDISYDEDIKNIDLKRFATEKEIAKTILYLSSDDSTYINGSVLFVDGWFN